MAIHAHKYLIFPLLARLPLEQISVHTITGGWGHPILPLISGHEIVGHVVRVGPQVKSFKVGDRAGVGAQICSCLECDRCNADNEQYCPKQVDTYNAKYPNVSVFKVKRRGIHVRQGDIAHGGYSTAVRAHERFVFPLPAGLPLEQIAPMLCAGITVYSPLVRNNTGPGKRVGIVGIGGLGHFAIQFARALEAEQVVAFSHSTNKEKDARALGATDFVITGNKDFTKGWQGKLDLIICTADVSRGIPLTELMTTLKVHGRLIMVAVPDDKLPALHTFDIMGNGALLGGSHIGSKKEVIDMLELAVKKGVKSWIEVLDMKDAARAVNAVKNNTVKYRHVLRCVDVDFQTT
ncbi:NADP-dependent alcohol dehydrogenase 6 [Termitomyces sp. J132]|nr:NADP-dependent alcohol dehydrogenase 6 [Termitomyces sp. J132]